MLLFALLGLYLLLLARSRLAGLMLGLAVASKWTTFFFAIPTLAFVFANRRYLDGSAMFMAALGGYTLSYIHLMVAKAFGAFVCERHCVHARGVLPTVNMISGWARPRLSPHIRK